MRTRLAALGVGLAVATSLPSCSPELGPGDGSATTRPRAEGRHDKPARRPKPRERPPTADLPILSNEGLDPKDRFRIARAKRDLERLGFWKELTGHLAVVRVATRPGPERVPEDGHLADALYTAKITGRVRGRVCDILIFSQALADDVGRQASYYAEGRLASPPPTLRQFWAVILAHELAHCTKRGQRGETFSSRWERRVLAAYGASRVGSR